MIEAKNLRLGNRVYSSKTLEKGIVHMIGYQDGVLGVYLHVSPFDSSGGIFIPDIHLGGIVLTEEVLSKMKSRLRDMGYTEQSKNFSGGLFRLEVRLNGGYITTCDYLHEYQNLYHALIGEELIINL